MVKRVAPTERIPFQEPEDDDLLYSGSNYPGTLKGLSNTQESLVIVGESPPAKRIIPKVDILLPRPPSSCMKQNQHSSATAWKRSSSGSNKKQRQTPQTNSQKLSMLKTHRP